MSTSLRKALEDELAASPDDLAACAAYADLLEESGDPRGEFIQIQLSLEDPDLEDVQRAEYARREREQLDEYGRQWLGRLAPLLDDWDIKYSFRRGWLDSLKFGQLSLAQARALRDSPEVRLLRRLEINEALPEDDAPEPSDGVPDYENRSPGFWPLAAADTLANVRSLRLGADDGDEAAKFHGGDGTAAAVPILRKMPRIEELHLFGHHNSLSHLFALTTLDNLRVLKAYHCAEVHRLDILANNPHLRNLTHLLFHPHAVDDENDVLFDIGEEGYIPLRMVQALVAGKHLTRLTHLQLRCSSMGDEGIRTLIESGMLKRLKVLDLRHGRVTDAGAQLLIASPDVRSLGWLDLSYNALSPEGEAAVNRLGVPCQLGDQHGPGETSYLSEGDME